jgi:hypothetical protein
MKKNIAGPKKIRLSRETLLRLNPEQLGLPVGGATVGTTCEPTSNCGGTLQCTNTACRRC